MYIFVIFSENINFLFHIIKGCRPRIFPAKSEIWSEFGTLVNGIRTFILHNNKAEKLLRNLENKMGNK